MVLFFSGRDIFRGRLGQPSKVDGDKIHSAYTSYSLSPLVQGKAGRRKEAQTRCF